MGQVNLLVTKGATKAPTYIGVPLEESIASRSSVIEALTEAGGLAELPEDIELEDMLSWAELKPDQASEMSVDELTFALQVGDRLGDKQMHAWADAMAKLLRGTVWSNGPQSTTMQTALFSLNDNVKGLVFHQLASTEGSHITAEMSHWPLAVQQAYCDVLVETGAIEILSMQDRPLQTLLAVLSRTASPAGGLSKLSLHAGLASQCTSALLSQALQHHATSLSSLHIHKLVNSEEGRLSAKIIFGNLRSLSHLTCLCINQFSLPANSPASNQVIKALATSISSLRSLTHFELLNLGEVKPGPNSAPSEASNRKRLRLFNSSSSNSQEPLSLDPIIKALSTAPSLTSLTLFFSNRAGLQTPFLCRGIRGPFTSLQKLNIDIQSSDFTLRPPFPDGRSLFPVMMLPVLTSLKFDCDDNTSSALTVETISGFLRQSSAKEATLCMPWLSAAATTHMQHHFTALSSLVALHLRVQHLDEHPSRFQAVMAGVATLTALTSLELHVSDFAVENNDNWSYQRLRSLCSPLTELKSLNDLVLIASQSANEAWASADVLLNAPLSALTQLTRLVIVPGECTLVDVLPLSTEALAEHLPHLKSLRELAVCGLKGSPAALQTCLKDLSMLTKLEVSTEKISADMLRCVGETLQGLPDLRSVRVSFFPWPPTPDNGPASGWMEGLPAMPRRGEYVFCCTLDIDSTCVGIRQELESMGADVLLERADARVKFRFPS